MSLKTLIKNLALTAMAAAMIFTAPTDYAVADSSLKTLSSPSQEEIAAYAQKHPTDMVSYSESGLPLNGYTIRYRINPQTSLPFAAGSLSDDELTCALNTVKTIRYAAGLSDDIYLSDEYNSLAQASSLVNYVNNKLTHTPAAPDGMDSALAGEGYRGSLRSNIAWTSWQNNTLKWTIIHGWMDDSDANNLPTLGHRRWILNPSMGMTGFGSVTGSRGTYNAMYAHDTGNPSGNVDGAVCWPSANTPLSYFGKDAPWSISVGHELNADDISVSLVRERDSKMWTFSNYYSDGDFYVNNQNFGQKGCIIFRPSNVGGYKNDDTFYVKVYGLGNDLSYEVNFFDLEGFYAPDPPVMESLTLNSVDKPKVEWAGSADADGYNIYRKVRGGSWRLLAENLEDCIYEDASAGKGIRYYYRTTALKNVNGTLYESQPSDYKYVTVPLSQARITSAKSTARGTNYIKWSSVSKASGYKVYRRTAGSSKWTLVKTTGSLYFKDVKKTSGRKYEYRVRAYRTYNSYTTYGGYSPVKSVKTK